MNSLVKSDIFFFITSIAVISIALVCLAALFFLIKIIKDIKHIAKTARIETDHIAKDIETYRQDLKQGEKEIEQFARSVKKTVK